MRLHEFSAVAERVGHLDASEPIEMNLQVSVLEPAATATGEVIGLRRDRHVRRTDESGAQLIGHR